jgi:hypothetical protein
MDIGYTMLCEQTRPKQLVSDLVRAEEIGFGFSGDLRPLLPMARGPRPFALRLVGPWRGSPGHQPDRADDLRHLPHHALSPCGPELKPYLEAVRAYQDAGFTHVALVQIGAERQGQFFEFAAAEPLPALREL